MTLGMASKQGDLFNEIDRFLDEALDECSIYWFLHRERARLFPDEAFADLFEGHGRRSVPPSVVATIMVLQRLEGLSDREAVERFSFDARWRYATGVGGYGNDGWKSFSHTVLVDMRERLRRSERPDRVFEAALEAAHAAGLVGRRRVLDSTPLYDAVATMDTVTLIRSAVRGLLKVAAAKLAVELRAVLRSGDDYLSSAKPSIDWDDAEAREALIDSRAKDAYGCLRLLDGRSLDRPVQEAAKLLATVVGQDVEEGDDGIFRIRRKVAKDRVISTVDPEARHGHKTAARSFDGYKCHVALDPDSEIVTATTVTAGNAGDASVAEDLIADLVQDREEEPTPPADALAPAASSATETATPAKEASVVYGDNAYGTGPFQEHLASAGIDSRCKTQQPTAPGGLFAKDRFKIDLTEGAVTCPSGVTVVVRFGRDGGGMASFGEACAACALRAHCTSAKTGRTITISPCERALAAARARQANPGWRDDYRATRPKVERKIGHLMRRLHGGRRARMRGAAKIAADFRLLGAAANLARLAVLRVTSVSGRWAVAAA